MYPQAALKLQLYLNLHYFHWFGCPNLMVITVFRNKIIAYVCVVVTTSNSNVS